MMPGMAENDLILVIDADTLISQNFISEAAARFSQDRRLGGVSGIYAGKPGGYLVGWYGDTGDAGVLQYLFFVHATGL